MDLDNKVRTREMEFYLQMPLSEMTVKNYRLALNSRYVKDFLLSECGVGNLFELDDLDVLWQLYSKINRHPFNIEKRL